jgi:hypothetical protein
MMAALKSHKHSDRREPTEVPAQDRKACYAHDLPDDLADAVENARMDSKFNYLNTLLAK